MKVLSSTVVLVVILALQQVQAQGKIGGYMFGDYFYNIARDSSFQGSNSVKNAANGGQKDLQAFQFRRIYFTYDNDISDVFTSRFRLEADQAALTSNSKITVFVKDAYLKWKGIFSGSDLIFGMQPTPAYEISEAAWGYRSLEKTIMDLRGIVPSRELGVSLKGRLVESGTLNYWATISNNSTSSSVPNATAAADGKFKRYSLNLQVKPTPEFQITAYGSFLPRPQVAALTGTSTVSNSTFIGALFMGYSEKDKYSVGVEGFLASTANSLRDTASLKALNTIGFTVYGTVNVNPDLAVVARYDYFDPNTDSNAKGDMRNYFIGGLSWKVDKNVSIIPNVLVETYESLPNGGRSISASVTGRVTFYYVFLESK